MSAADTSIPGSRAQWERVAGKCRAPWLDRIVRRLRDDSGLMGLEWLLIVASIAALGASSALVVQQVLSVTSEDASGPEVSLIEADIAAAQLTSEYAATINPYEALFIQRCADLAVQFDDVVDTASWEREMVAAPTDDPATPLKNESVTYPARCLAHPR